MKSKYIIGIIIILVIIGFAYEIYAAGANNNKITIAGSTSVQPVAEKLATTYMAEHPNIKIDVQGGGSAVGIKSVEQGTVKIGSSSENLPPEDSGILNQTIIGKDGIAIIVNNENSINNLTTAQLMGIYSGNITNWDQVGGKNAQIDVIAREQGSGTRSNFEKLVLNGSQIEGGAIVQSSTEAVKQSVIGDPNAIGFISFSNLDSTVKAVSIDGISISDESVENGSYKIQGPFLFLTKGEPKGAVKDFINWVTGPEGQTIVKSTNTVPIN